MKILYCSEGYSPHDYRFLSALSASPHNIHWFRLRQDLVLENRPLSPAIQPVARKQENKANHWFDYLQLKNEFRRVLDKVQPDLVHAGPIQKVALLAALNHFHPLISMSWGTDLLMDADRDFIWQNVTRFTLKQTDWLIGDCLAVQNKAMKFGFPSERSTIFPWGIDLNIFRPAKKSLLRLKQGWEDDFIILCTRNWESRYGVELVVRAFCENAGRMKDAILVLVGGGSQEALLRKMVLDAGLIDRVVFAGRVDYPDLPRYYQAADLYVSASHSDGSSVSLLEALGCGCPVLVSDIIANREWVQPGWQGWLFKDGDWKEMGEMLVTIFNQREEQTTIRENARQTAIQKADWIKNFIELLETYKKVYGLFAR